jgi:DNA-binding transcriptional ArsR family regulator
MTRRATTPKEIAEILTLREVGYTAISIAERLNLSLSTVNRHLAAHGVKKGCLKQEAIDKARGDLLELVNSDAAIREAAAKEIADTLAHSSHLRAIMLQASEHLKTPTSLSEAALVMRAAAAYSTAIKNTSDTIRHALGTDKVTEDNKELPELTITELTAEDIAKLKSRELADNYD